MTKTKTIKKKETKKTQKKSPKVIAPGKKKVTPKTAEIKVPEKAVIDLTAYDWGDTKLNDRQKLFIIWFCTPGTETYHCAMKAARKAGYTKSTANVAAHKMRRDPVIEKVMIKFEDSLGRINLVDTARRWLQEKIIRGDYDVNDYYETVEYKNIRTGKKEKQLLLKPLEELTPEQRLCIDGIDVKGQKGVMIYTLPDREKIRDSLISMIQKQEMAMTGDGQDPEETKEIIIERITIREKQRMEKAVEVASYRIIEPVDSAAIEEEL